MHAALEAAKIGSHILAIYSDKEKKLEEAFEFLQAGLDANEAVVLISNDVTKDEARKIISTKLKVDDIEDLEKKGDILIITTKEAYFPDGKIDIDKIIAQWRSFSETAVSRGKKAMRVFGDMTGFFSHGLANELVDYESALPATYSIPVIGLCAYEAENINSLTPEQFAILHQHHSIYQLEGHDVLSNPQNNSHTLMVYENDTDLYQAIAKYLNEGLKRNQLCVYASIHNSDENHISKIASKIEDYERNVAEGNLIALNFAPVYIAAVCGDLSSYKRLATRLAEMTKGRKDKHVRLVADCAMFMFQNKHFDECATLEAWGQEKPIFGSYVCPYPKSLFEKYPFNYQKFRILVNHDLAVDTAGNILAVYSKEVGQ
jgi:hypothetical protein